MKNESYHKGNVREALIEAAERVLQDEGIAALSLRRVAREVGVVPSAVYNHFKNREALLASVAADGYKKIQALEIAVYADDDTPATAIRRLARAYLHFAAESPNLYRLMFSPDVVDYRNDPELGEAGDSSFGLSVNWWYGAGTYDPHKSAVEYPLALSTWALLHGLAMQLIDGLITVDVGDKQAIDMLADSIMEVFINGIGKGFQ